MVFKAGYRLLPKELIDIIWSYDNRYKMEFKNCIYELNHYFHKHRCMDIIHHENNLYSFYLLPNESRIKANNNMTRLELYEYILKRRKIFRRQYHNINLYNLDNLDNLDNICSYILRRT